MRLAKKQIFGEIKQGKMILSKVGEIARKELEKLSRRFPRISMDGFVVMPNHIHALITISADSASPNPDTSDNLEGFKHPVPGSIPTIVRSYKAAVTQRVSVLRDASVSVVWQRNYYEHVVRNENERERIFAYIVSNPVRWDSDEENPGSVK